MKKLIKLEFENTTKERKTADSYSELYSYDKNNGSFEFEILNDTLTTEQVTALFKFTDSNKIWKTTGTVEGNKVNVTFDTTLITQNETVICYLYFDDEQRTSDAFRFKFKVKVSEIDKMNRYEVKERFINNTVIVDRLNVVTKTELQEALKNVGGITTEGLLTEVKAEELYAKKSDLPTPYNDSALVERITLLENRPSTGGGNVDVNDFVTNEAFDKEIKDINESFSNMWRPFYIGYVDEETAKEYLDSIPHFFGKPRFPLYAGGIFAKMNGIYPQNVQIFKGDENNSQFVDFDAAMYSLANSLPTGYSIQSVSQDINNKVLFLSNKNFSEVVPKEELKAVIKEILIELKSENN